MRSRATFFILFFVVSLLTIPLFAHANSIPFFGPIIPDANKACPAGWGMLIVVINNIILLLLTLAIVFVAPLMIAWSGFLFVVNPVHAEGISKAKGILRNTVVGIVIALAGWLIVDALMAVLYNGKFGTWSEIITSGGASQCLDQKGTEPGAEPIVAPPGVAVVPSVPGCPTCVSLTDKGLTCKDASSCTLNSAVADKLVTLKNNFSGTWTVTEAFPSTATHSNPCHANGTCIDAGFRGNTTYTATNIAEFATDARSAGLRPVFETASCSLRDQARALGVTAYCKTDQGYGLITGDHFSVYSS